MFAASPSPTKRRKTKGAFAMKSAKGTKDMKSANNIKEAKYVSWPPGRLPVELFTLIASYLPRSNIQNMRLVNKEFDLKVSEALFRIVVVPFRPEIYGITPETTSSNEVLQGSIMIQDKGMRVFQGFGRWIQRFAMSFEIDHIKLANPPRKSDQEAITSFWGIYRWPFKTYNRYSQLEGLEQTADETRTMAKALAYITNAQELGLSIDGGLGWLSGPDTNQRVAERGDKRTVFGASKFAPEPSSKQSKQIKVFSVPNPDAQASNTHAAFERMLQEAGYTGDELQPSIQMLLESEEAGGDTPPISSGTLNVAAQAPQTTDARRRPRRRDLFNGSNVLLNYPPADRWEVSDDEDVDDETGGIMPAAALSAQRSKPKSEGYLLKPNDLTNAQREMLLEMEWAQNAFMQSWAIAIMDNHSTFKAIRKLSIARLPSRHLSILRREDFWDSLPRLNSLSLAVVPDWREVKKEATSWVQDTRIAPSQSIPGVYDLLTQQISKRENIKTLHFEWLCGGEYTPGIFARNQNILAAPVVSSAMYMANRSQKYEVLAFPYVEHLSLKNCWMSPHIMSRFLDGMRQEALQSISFDSVSLTAMVPAHAQPNPLAQAAVPQNAQNAAAFGPANNMLIALQGLQALPIAQTVHVATVLPTVSNTNTEPDWLQHPRAGSWVDVIDNMAPGTTLADIRYSKGFGPEPETRPSTRLFKLTFESCGYVKVPLDFDQTILDPPQVAPAQTASVTKRMNEIDSHMMKPLDGFTMGSIINHLDPTEASALENAWNLNVGWRPARSELAADALLDGFSHAGQGRFDGTIDIPQAEMSKRFSP